MQFPVPIATSSLHLYAFGSNGECQLGLPAAEIVNTPTQVPNPSPNGDYIPLDGLKAIICGDNHTLFHQHICVGGVGDNRKHQLGKANLPSRLDHFQEVDFGRSFVAATCETSAFIGFRPDYHNQSQVAIKGSNNWGELGDCDGSSSNLLLQGQVVDFVGGVWHYVAVMQDGSVYGWGKARLGQLGEALSGKVTTPTKIEGIRFKPKKAVCGKDFTYLVGDPAEGQHQLLGKDKFNILSNMPGDVKNWKDVGAAWHAIFVLFEDGTLTAWGKENMWKLLPPNLPLLDKIAVGSDHILAVTREGKLISWGWGKHGNCGDLSNIEIEIENDMVSGFWNEISIPGKIENIGAGFCTSFVVTRQPIPQEIMQERLEQRRRQREESCRLEAGRT
ncbi:hypothetical protein G6011_11443 [Alternaria panax]|uniref:Uncharacterized protein n=1 Tax=Alternaria panax TaxID=48097 RepID=A0AAD4IDT5_9PLEO|nr:hypothetical protein G6011_11443 [Alternaria panax]